MASRSDWQHGAAQEIQTATSLDIFHPSASKSLPEGSRTLSGSAEPGEMLPSPFAARSIALLLFLLSVSGGIHYVRSG